MRIKCENIFENCIELHSELRRRCLGTHDLEQAATLAEFIGEFAHHNHYGIYFDPQIEDHLFKLGTNESVLEVVRKPENKEKQKTKILHVLTKSYLSGGHTRVVENWCEITQFSFENNVVLTHQEKLPIPERLRKKSFALYSIAMGGYVERAIELAKYFHQHDVIILHTHPQDVLPILACSLLPGQSEKMKFYNNSDHAFAYNMSVCDRVYENSAFGFEVSRRKRLHGKPSSYVAIPLCPSAINPVQTETPDDGYILSTGTAYKFKPYKDMDFAHFAVGVAAKTKRRFIIVGPDRRQDPYWQQAYQKSGGLVDAIGGVEHSRYLDLLSNASAYVESFPYIGGVAFSEALLCGVPVFGVQMPCSGYSPLDRLREPTLQCLENRLESFMRGECTDYLATLVQLQGLIIDYQVGGGFGRSFARVLEESLTDSKVPYFSHPQNVEYFEEMWAAQGVIKFDHKLLRRLPLVTGIAIALLITKVSGGGGKVLSKMVFDLLRKRK